MDKLMTLWWKNYTPLNRGRASNAPRVRHFNYCDEQDPVGGELDFAYTAKAVDGTFDMVEDRVFVRYPAPLVAHSGYWNDHHLMRRILALAVGGGDPREHPFRSVAAVQYLVGLLVSYIVVPGTCVLGMAWITTKCAKAVAARGWPDPLWALAGVALLLITRGVTKLAMQWRELMANPRGPHSRRDPSLRWRRGVGDLFKLALYAAPLVLAGLAIQVLCLEDKPPGPLLASLEFSLYTVGLVVTAWMTYCRIRAAYLTDPERDELPSYPAYVEARRKATETMADPTPAAEPATPSPVIRVENPRRDFGVLAAILVAIYLVASQMPMDRRETAWGINLVLFATFVVYFGYSITGRVRGAFIDSRRRVSLSRFQMICWTVLILSSLLTAALTNLAYGSATPLNIDVPSSIWVVMGISTASLVGSPAINANKTTADADSLVRNKDPKQAKWSDLLMGEEKGNSGVVDIGKIQMFFFTFILLITYGSAIAAQLAPDAGIITAFPPVDDGINVLLGISHTGYLASKGIKSSGGNDD